MTVFQDPDVFPILLGIAVFVFITLLLLLLMMIRQQRNINRQFGVLDVIHQQISINEKFQESQQKQLSSLFQALPKLSADLTLSFEKQTTNLRMKLLRQLAEQSEKSQREFHQFQQLFSEQQAKAIDQWVEHLNKANQVNRSEMSENMTKLTETTDKRLQDISGQVEKRLSEGFDKTTKTFNDIVKRLALIDDAQKKITELSTNVVSLQEVLADKRSRGAFGEVQLNSLIRNVLPEQHFSLQHTLSNGKVADCVVFLPEPTGNVVIDAKFPLESYRKLTDINSGEFDRKQAERQFKIDIKKHIQDISGKYLIDNETAEGAVMFIPAEAVFAEIHAHHPDLVEQANLKRVWLVSPTTLMAILTTARSVLKDEATRKQIHIIQAHLSELAQDFGRFKGRFSNLAKHIDQAAVDVKQIHTSADKISSRFEKIEQVELSEDKQDEMADLTIATK